MLNTVTLLDFKSSPSVAGFDFGNQIWTYLFLYKFAAIKIQNDTFVSKYDLSKMMVIFKKSEKKQDCDKKENDNRIFTFDDHSKLVLAGDWYTTCNAKAGKYNDLIIVMIWL